jgi:hypothetical protein
MRSLCSTASRWTLASSRVFVPAGSVRSSAWRTASGSGSSRSGDGRMAKASAMPSKVEVPRPISSISTRLFGRVVQDGGGFGHFDHEGRAAGGEVVGGADAGEDAVERAEHAALAGTIAADVGEQGDQRRLPHVGRFTAHVRAGDQQQAAAFVSKQAVVGDEGFDCWPFRPSTTGWRPPLRSTRFRSQIPACSPVALEGGVGKAGQQVELGDGAGDGLQRAARGQQFRGCLRRAAFRAPARVPGPTAPCPRRPSARA